MRRQGTGLQVEQLLGEWRLQQVWPRDGGTPSALAAPLLRGFGAALALGPAQRDGLTLVNRVRLGSLELRFEGQGTLEGARPLLGFGFDRCLLCWGDRRLFSWTLPAADPRRRPFFALLGRGRTAAGQEWLAARGRGGGLALWVLAGAEPMEARPG